MRAHKSRPAFLPTAIAKLPAPPPSLTVAVSILAVALAVALGSAGSAAGQASSPPVPDSTPVNATPEQVQKSVFVGANLTVPEQKLNEEAFWLKVQNEMLKGSPDLTWAQIKGSLTTVKQLFASHAGDSKAPQRTYVEVAGEIIDKLVTFGDALAEDKAFTAAFELLKKRYMAEWSKEEGDDTTGRNGATSAAAAERKHVVPALEEAFELAKTDPRASAAYAESALAAAAGVTTASTTEEMLEAHPEMGDLLTPLVDPDGGVTSTTGQLKDELQNQIGEANEAVSEGVHAVNAVGAAQDAAAAGRDPLDPKSNPTVASKEDEAAKAAIAAVEVDQKRVAEELKIVKGVSHALGALLTLWDPEAGKQFTEVADATIQAAGSIFNFATSIGRLALGDPTAVMGAITSSLDLVQTIGGVIPIFFGAEPNGPPKRTPEQALSDQITKLSENMAKFATGVNERFDRLEEGLNQVYVDLQTGLAKIDNRLNDIDEDLATVRATLERHEEALFTFERNAFEYEQGSRRELLVLNVNQFVNYLDKSPGVPLDEGDFFSTLGPVNVFHAHGTTFAFQPFAKGPEPSAASLQPQNVLEELHQYPLEARLDYLSALGQSLGAPAFAQSRPDGPVGPRDWAMAAGAYASVASDWPELMTHLTSQRLDDLVAVGRGLRNDLARISRPDVPAAAGEPAKSRLFQELFQNYRERLLASDTKLRADAWLTGVEDGFETERGVDPFGAADQLPTRDLGSNPTVPNVPPCEAATGRPTLAAPSDIAGSPATSMFPRQYLNARYLTKLRNAAASLPAVALCYSMSWDYSFSLCNERFEPDCQHHASQVMTLRSSEGGAEIRRRAGAIAHGLTCGTSDSEPLGGSDPCTASPYAGVQAKWENDPNGAEDPPPLRNRFEHAATDAAARLSAATSQVNALLRQEQSDLYNRIAGRIPAAGRTEAFEQLEGAKLALALTAKAGFSRALDADGTLNAMLFGDHGLMGEDELVKLYRDAAADPPPENARHYLVAVGKAWLATTENALWAYTDGIATGAWAESDPVVEATLLRLKIARSIIEAERARIGGPTDPGGSDPTDPGGSYPTDPGGSDPTTPPAAVPPGPPAPPAPPGPPGPPAPPSPLPPPPAGPTPDPPARKNSLAAAIEHGVKLSVKCTRRCRISVTAHVDRRTARRLGIARRAAVVGKGKASLRGKGRKVVTVKLTRKAKKGLRKARKAVLRLKVARSYGKGAVKRSGGKVTLRRL